MKITKIQIELSDGRTLWCGPTDDEKHLIIHGCKMGIASLSREEAIGIKDMLGLLYPVNTAHMEFSKDR